MDEVWVWEVWDFFGGWKWSPMLSWFGIVSIYEQIKCWFERVFVVGTETGKIYIAVMGTQLRALLKPLGTILRWCSRVFRAMPRVASDDGQSSCPSQTEAKKKDWSEFSSKRKWWDLENGQNSAEASVIDLLFCSCCVLEVF